MRYRESNASRLRQEIKGMIRNPRSVSSRSNSASESGSPCSRVTTSRNTTPGGTSPGSISRQPSIERSKVQRKDRRRMDHSLKPKKDDDKLPEISDTPPFSASVNSSKLASNTLSGHVFIDSRSKTVNNVSPGHQPAPVDALNTLNQPKVRNENARAGAFKSAETKGYGRPLVTPVNKRLTIRRDPPWPFNNPNGAKKVTTPNCSGTKSPDRKNKAENRESPSQNASLQQRKLIGTKIPTKVTVSGNKLRESITNPNVFPDTKIPTLRTNVGAKYYSNSSTCKNKLENHNSPEIKHWTADRSKPPPHSPNRSKSPMQDRIAAAAKRKSPSSNKEKPSNKETSPTPLTRPYPPVHNNRSFKPQLEDIKSSNLLLNKISQDCANTVTKADNDEYRESNEVIKFNEESRKQKLVECKRKFQSTKFFEDSRFEKIEGLNWISWK